MNPDILSIDIIVFIFYKQDMLKKLGRKFIYGDIL